MKILRDDMVRTADADPLDLFYQGIRSEETRGRYTRTLRQVLCEIFEDMLTGTFEERAAQLVRLGRDDPGWTCDLLIILARKLRARIKLPRDDPEYLNPLSFGNYYSPIKKLFAMNDVAIQWGRIHATFPELDNMPDSMGWTRPEIARMLKHTRDARDRALVLVLASSGMRAGAPHQLNWGDLTPVYRNGGRLTLDPGEGSGVACAMLNVYRGSAESYTAFITPEAFAALQEYARAWSGRMGRQAGPKDPMFIVMRYVPKRATQTAIQRRVEGVVAQAGLREARDGKRYRVPLMNGFRRFYNKTCKEAMSGDSTLGLLIKHEYMMGHRGLTSLDENYFKTDGLELAAAYVKAVPDLTIDDADRLRLSNRRMSDNIRAMEGEKNGVVARLEAEAARREEEMARLKRENANMAARLEAEAARREEEMARLKRENANMAVRLKRENANMAVRLKRENSEEMESMRGEIAELKKRQNMPAAELLAALRNAPETGGVPATIMESLIGMVDQFGKAQEAAIRDIKNEHSDEMDELRREVARLAGAGKDGGPPAKFGEDGGWRGSKMRDADDLR